MKHLDKYLHFLFGIVLGLSFLAIGNWSIILVLAASLGKEIWDVFDDETKEDVELMDFIASALGGWTTIMILAIWTYYFR